MSNSKGDPVSIADQQAELEQMVEDLLREAARQGASSAEAGVSRNSGLSVDARLGDVETIEHTRDQGLGVTVYFGRRKGTASTSDFGPDAIRDTVRAACNIARFTMEDPFAGLADADRIASSAVDLDLFHPWELDAEEAIEIGKRCEAAAMEVDGRITNSEGASVGAHEGLQVYGNSHGFIGGYPSTRHSLSCAVIGRDGDEMQRDYWYTVARSASRLEAADDVGRQAGGRTLARLGARRLSTRRAPVIFQADVAVGLLRSFVGAIGGTALYRRATFLLDSLGERVFPEFVRIHEDPLISGGLASGWFDSEGVATKASDLVSAGVVQHYVLSSYSARKLSMETTGNAGGVRNLSIESTGQTREQLLKEMGTGLLVTELMGQGINMVTGDYSRGASGFWVENGDIQYPVEEITIAGNLKEMFAQLLAVGRDEELRGSVRSGSWLIESMTIAGEGH